MARSCQAAQACVKWRNQPLARHAGIRAQGTTIAQTPAGCRRPSKAPPQASSKAGCRQTLAVDLKPSIAKETLRAGQLDQLALGLMPDQRPFAGCQSTKTALGTALMPVEPLVALEDCRSCCECHLKQQANFQESQARSRFSCWTCYFPIRSANLVGNAKLRIAKTSSQFLKLRFLLEAAHACDLPELFAA